MRVRKCDEEIERLRIGGTDPAVFLEAIHFGRELQLCIAETWDTYGGMMLTEIERITT